MNGANNMGIFYSAKEEELDELIAKAQEELSEIVRGREKLALQIKWYDDRRKTFDEHIKDYSDLRAQQRERLSEIDGEFYEFKSRIKGGYKNVASRINKLAKTAQPAMFKVKDKVITTPDYGNPVQRGTVRQVNENDEGVDFYSYIVLCEDGEQREFLESELQLDK